MPRPPRLNLRLPELKLPRPHLNLHLPRLEIRRYQVGALWVLVALAALATLPSPLPSNHNGEAFGASAEGPGARDEAMARYQAWLHGRAASQDASIAQAAAQQADAGPGAAAPTPRVTTPTASDTDIPAIALRAYRLAESWASGFDPNCELSWSVLAGIGRIESNHGRHFGDAARFSSTGDVTPTILGPVLNGAPNTGTIHDTDGGRLDGDTVWDRAVGPMQFIPSTWQSLGRDGNGDGVANPNNFFDAAVSAAGYLCLSGGGSLADQANLRRAVYAYNHSWEYVSAVISWANFYLRHEGQGSLVQVEMPTGPSSPPQSGIPVGATVATTSGATTTPTAPRTSASPSTTGALPGASSSSSSSTSSTGPPPTTVPPTSSSTTTTSPSTTTTSPSTTTTSPSTTTEPCATTTTSGTTTTTTTTSTSSTTTTTTTTTSSSTTTTTTTTTPPCQDQ